MIYQFSYRNCTRCDGTLIDTTTHIKCLLCLNGKIVTLAKPKGIKTLLGKSLIIPKP